MDKYLITEYCIRHAHPLEPFPLYMPQNRLDKLIWALIRVRWKIISPFVRYKSMLNGRSLIRKGD